MRVTIQTENDRHTKRNRQKRYTDTERWTQTQDTKTQIQIGKEN